MVTLLLQGRRPTPVFLLQEPSDQSRKAFRLLLRPFQEMWRDKEMRIDHRGQSFRWPPLLLRLYVLFWYPRFL
jgi:hypothetical protein